MRQQFAGHLGVAMLGGDLLERLCQDLLDQLVPCFRDGRDVGPVLNAKLLEILLPRPTFRRLDADFLADLDEMSIVDQPLDKVAHLRAKGALIDRDVVDQQIGQVFRCGANADIGARLGGEARDQE